MTSQLPCASRVDVYDSLFSDVPKAERAKAKQIAVRLCGACPAPCAEQVTAGSRPRSTAASAVARSALTGRTGGRAASRIAAWSATHPVGEDVGVWRSDAYVPPGERIPAAAGEAADLAGRGWTTEEIAVRLCVGVETAAALLAIAHQTQAA